MTGWLRWVPAALREHVRHAVDTTGGAEDWRQLVPPGWRTWLDASPAPRPQSRTLRFVGIDEATPGARWQALHAETWEAYRRWWLREGGEERPGRADCEAALRRFMPELVGTHEKLVQLAGDDGTASAMLTLWNPPPFIVACSQTVVPDGDTGEPVLLRNYDYDPRLFEATVYRSRWSSRRVVGTGDCLWGLVDGLNDDGLAVSLTFGGRQEIGEGFGIPLVIRYLLEVAGNVGDGIDVLRRVPHQLSYNVTLCDPSGRVATVLVAPDRPATVSAQRAITNHPETVEWPEHAAWVRSVERLQILRDLAAGGADADAMTAAMLTPPLLARRWDEGFATLFTAAYRPVSRRLDYHWPTSHVPLALQDSIPDTFDVVLDAESSTPTPGRTGLHGFPSGG